MREIPHFLRDGGGERAVNGSPVLGMEWRAVVVIVDGSGDGRVSLIFPFGGVHVFVRSGARPLGNVEAGGRLLKCTVATTSR